MKGIMKLMVVVAGLFAVWPAAAQQPDPAGVVAHVLELSPAQVTPWVEILHSRQAALQPLVQQVQARQQEIGQALDSVTPDPASIGRALIDIKSLQKQIEAANAQFAAQFEQLLTSGQLDRLNGIRSAARICPVVPAFQATGLAP